MSAAGRRPTPTPTNNSMNTIDNISLAQAATEISALAWSASSTGLAHRFQYTSAWLAFVARAEAAGYPFADLAYEIDPNGTSVKNEAEQAAQFAHSVLDNESAPDTIAAREKDAAEEAARLEARAEAQLANTAAGRGYTATVARWKAEGFEVNEEVVAPEPYSHGGQRVASIYQGSGYGHQHAFLSIRLVIGRTSKQRTTLRRYASTEKGRVSYTDGARWLGILAEHGPRFRSEAARAEAAAVVEAAPAAPAVVALPVPPRLVSTAVGEVAQAAPDASDPAVRAEVTTTTWQHADGRLTTATATRILGPVVPVAAVADPYVLSPLDFIVASEERTLTQGQFDASAQAFVDSGVWRSLQGSWQRTVYNWAEDGLVTI